MSKSLFVLLVCSITINAVIACPNMCSKRGTCGAFSKCTCDPGFGGDDCSERQCPYHYSHADVPYSTNKAHKYAECSGKGICDKKSGICSCFPGYEGSACRRTSCLNSCSGHGTCETMEFVGRDSSPASGGAADRSYDLWDGVKHQICKCAPYWSGVDCSKRMCPRGDDPMTTGQVNQQQTIDLNPNGAFSDGKFTLTFVDKFNGVWTTRPIGMPSSTAVLAAAEMQRALNGLPNEVIKGATVSCTKTSNRYVYVVSFGKYNTGNQNLLQINVNGCNVEGCQPLFAATTQTWVLGYPKISVTRAATTENNVCSGRGACDSSVGVCKCYSGYFGEACEAQAVGV